RAARQQDKHEGHVEIRCPQFQTAYTGKDRTDGGAPSIEPDCRWRSNPVLSADAVATGNPGQRHRQLRQTRGTGIRDTQKTQSNEANQSRGGEAAAGEKEAIGKEAISPGNRLIGIYGLLPARLIFLRLFSSSPVEMLQAYSVLLRMRRWMMPLHDGAGRPASVRGYLRESCRSFFVSL